MRQGVQGWRHRLAIWGEKAGRLTVIVCAVQLDVGCSQASCCNGMQVLVMIAHMSWHSQNAGPLSLLGGHLRGKDQAAIPPALHLLMKS